MMWHATILGVPLLGRDYCNHGYHSLFRCCNRGHFIDKVHQSDYRTITTHCIYPTPRRQISLTQAVICHPAAISSLLLPRFAIICFSPTSEEGEATSYTFSSWNQNDVLMDYRMMMIDVLTMLAAGYVASRIEYSSCVSRHKPKLKGRRSN